MSPVLILDNTLGAALIGVVIAAILHGASIVQVWYYFGHQNDRWSTKYLVGAVMFFDTAHQALITHTVYTYTVTNWGNVEELQRIVWSMLLEVLFNGVTILLVQSFLAMRIWRLSSRKMSLTSVVVFLVLGEFGCVLGMSFDLNDAKYGSETYIQGSLYNHVVGVKNTPFYQHANEMVRLRLDTYEKLEGLKYLSILVNSLAAAGDLLIAATLCTLLHLSRTGFQRSNTMINKLIVFAVNTGLLTSLCAVASLISIVVAGQTFLYIAFFFCIGRLYTNSLLATLNMRKMIRGSADGINNAGSNLALSLREFPKNEPAMSRRPNANISIKIDATKESVTNSDQHQDYDLEKFENSSFSVHRFEEKGVCQV